MERIEKLLKGLGFELSKVLRPVGQRTQPQRQPEIAVEVVGPDATGSIVKDRGADEAVGRHHGRVRFLSREDLFGHDIVAVRAVAGDKRYLALMERISPEDAPALRAAAVMIRYLRSGDAEKSSNLRDRIRRRWKERGNRIALLYSSEVFADVVVPLLQIYEITPTPSDADRVKKVWDTLLDDAGPVRFVRASSDPVSHSFWITHELSTMHGSVVVLFAWKPTAIPVLNQAIETFDTEEEERQYSRLSHRIHRMVDRIGPQAPFRS